MKVFDIPLALGLIFGAIAIIYLLSGNHGEQSIICAIVSAMLIIFWDFTEDTKTESEKK